MRFCEICGAAFRSLRTCPKDGVTTRAGISDPLLGAVLGERYKILERIAAGGMGQVYRAAHTRIACLFAVKVLYGDLAYDPSMQSRFLREAEVSSCLQSRHIVRVVDFGQAEGGLPYLVMEFLDGSTLFDVVAREGAIVPERAVRIAQRIARGLAHAHERGIVHRDMKTENVILVREDDEADIPKLLDFGVARLRESDRLTTAGFVVGTPLYMAPEQFTGEDVDGRADLYALGVILYEMLAGVPPFEAPSVQGLADKHRNEAPPSLAKRLETKGASPELDRVLQRLLAKKADDRFGSAREAAVAIGEAIEQGSSTPRSVVPASTARSPVDPELVERIEATIREGAPAYNSGDHARCFELYRATVEAALGTVRQPLAVVARLRSGLRRALACATPTLAAWELRYTFDDLLFALPTRLASVGDTLSREYGAYAAIAARRESALHVGILGDFALEFARLLAVTLRERNEEKGIGAALDAAVLEGDRRGGGQAALAVVQPTLDLIRTRGTASATRPGPSISVAPSVASTSVSGQLPSSGPIPPTSLPPPPARGGNESLPPVGTNDDVTDAIVRAIRVGAPAYNDGRYDVCHRVYRETARHLADRARNDPNGVAFAAWLDDVVLRASTKPDRDAAWVLRHAFDAVLGARR